MKVLIIGLGSIANKHIAAMQKLGVTEIFALRSSVDSPERPGVNNLYSFDEVMAEKDFDFFLISNITSKHAEVIQQLIRFEKPLFIEKPLFGEVNASNTELVREILSRQIPTYVACSLRFLDSLKKVKELLKDYRINEVNIYSGSYLPNWRPNMNFRENYSARKELGGGVHIDLIHELDYLFWIFGEPEETSAVFTSNSTLDITSIDYANYIWRYKEFSANIILNYYRLDTKRTLEVVTSNGTILVDLVKNKIYKNSEEIFSSGQEIADTFIAQMDFFLNEVLNNKSNGFNSIDEAYKILELCLKD